jgi:acetyltransferase-like isoleucine patch superfamily enzyme
VATPPDPDDEPRRPVARKDLRFWLGSARWWLLQRLERRRWRRQGVRIHRTAVVTNVRFHGPAVVEARCRIRGNPRIEVGRDVYFGPHVHAQGEIELGDGAWVGPGAVFWGRDHGIEPGIPIRRQPHRTEPIRVGPGARIGPRAVLLRGVRIGAGAAVGAGSVCTRDVAPSAVVRGSPARPVAGSGGAA